MSRAGTKTSFFLSGAYPLDGECPGLFILPLSLRRPTNHLLLHCILSTRVFVLRRGARMFMDAFSCPRARAGCSPRLGSFLRKKDNKTQNIFVYRTTKKSSLAWSTGHNNLLLFLLLGGIFCLVVLLMLGV